MRDFISRPFEEQLLLLNKSLLEGLTVKEIREKIKVSEKVLQRIIKQNGFRYDQKKRQYVSNTKVTKSNTKFEVIKNNEYISKNIGSYQSNTGVTLESEEHKKLIEMIDNYDKLSKKLSRLDEIYEWYEKKKLDENVIDIEIPRLEIPNSSEQKEIVTRSFKLYSDVNDDFKIFCNNSNYKAQDIVSVALREFLDKYDRGAK